MPFCQWLTLIRLSHFFPGPSKESDRKARVKIIKQLQKEFEDARNGIGHFSGMFSLQA